MKTNMLNNLGKSIDMVNNDTVEKIVSVDIDKLIENKDNFYSIEDITELAESIRINGIRTPLIVDDNYVLISGHRRLEASKKVGLSQLPVIIRKYNNENERTRDLIEANNYRTLTPVEKAKAIEKMQEYYKATGVKNVTELVKETLNISNSTITRANKVNELVEEDKKALDNGDISMKDMDFVTKKDLKTGESVKKVIDEKKSSVAKPTREEIEAQKIKELKNKERQEKAKREMEEIEQRNLLRQCIILIDSNKLANDTLEYLIDQAQKAIKKNNSKIKGGKNNEK